MSVRVKICGLRTAEDALAAVAAGADALGFMFVAASPRRISFADASAILAQVTGTGVTRVGVFVNPGLDDIRRAVEECGIDALQLHGDESPEFVAELAGQNWFKLTQPTVGGLLPAMCRPGLIKAFRMRDAGTLTELPRFRTDLWLLDSYVPGQPGGTGSRFNWELAVQARRLGTPFLLAGGLTLDSVAEAVRHVRPFGVDVSSGVESAPGVKDHARIRAFVAAAKAAGDADDA